MLTLRSTSSTLLTDEMLIDLCQGGQVIEQDVRGLKVVRLSNGDFLKIFRARRWLSGARMYSHARRFYRNALRLQARNIPTVTVKSLHHLPKAGHTAVIYQPLAGQTLRQLMQSELPAIKSLAEKLGRFLAELHDQGIHFHSLHSGNVLLTPDGQFGLIDISDMTIYPWPLRCATRVRSFIRLGKYREEMRLLDATFWRSVMHGYSQSPRGNNCADTIMASVDYLQVIK
ncbi:hypothetical protein [Methylophilus aquaticus]|uniref:Toluene tolerance protein n=1 Tax=Methylophilus aquaticus TaxID=1971610 RepID=A0ABT9JTR3_9PROT|nr:hypothetical protein [Methylophilus aquaticus]MDP8567536.1 hypothetical protein [Methylophilus aquaticus]